MTGGKTVKVEKRWVDQYQLADQTNGEDFAAALMHQTGKVSSDGMPFQVWHDYVMGTNPTNVNDILRAAISLKTDGPVVSWTPNLNTNGEVRIYRVWGKADMKDSEWTYPTNSTHRFFKVTVELP